MSAPAGYTKLGVVGYSDKGPYSASAAYNKYNVVTYNGGTYVCILDNTSGIAPTNTNNWRTMIPPGSGHTIKDSAGTDMASQPNLQFIGAVLSDDSTNNTTVVSFPIFRGATASTAGVAGKVPVPSAGDQDKFLKGDGTWDDVKSSALLIDEDGDIAIDYDVLNS